MTFKLSPPTLDVIIAIPDACDSSFGSSDRKCFAFVSCLARIFSSFPHSFPTAAFASGIFIAFKHRNKLVHEIVVVQ